MISLQEYLRENTIIVGGLRFTNPKFDDVLAYNIGYNFDSSRGYIDNNYEEGGLDFNTGADKADFLDALTSDYQFMHGLYNEADAKIFLHNHWIQEADADDVGWVMEYRFASSTGFTAWTAIPSSRFAKAYPWSGSKQLQMSIDTTGISVAGYSDSAVLQVRRWRDSADAKDTVSGNVTLLFADAHIPFIEIGEDVE